MCYRIFSTGTVHSTTVFNIHLSRRESSITTESSSTTFNLLCRYGLRIYFPIVTHRTVIITTTNMVSTGSTVTVRYGVITVLHRVNSIGYIWKLARFVISECDPRLFRGNCNRRDNCHVSSPDLSEPSLYS